MNSSTSAVTASSASTEVVREICHNGAFIHSPLEVQPFSLSSRRSAAKPQPNGVRPSSGAETLDGDKCESNPEPQSSLKLLQPGTAALRKFVAACEQFRRSQCRREERV